MGLLLIVATVACVAAGWLIYRYPYGPTHGPTKGPTKFPRKGDWPVRRY